MPKTKPRCKVYPGYVACSNYGNIHEDNLDPYWYGEPEEGFDDQRCKPEHHRPVYVIEEDQ